MQYNCVEYKSGFIDLLGCHRETTFIEEIDRMYDESSKQPSSVIGHPSGI
jgi:hypothetical protein